MSKANFKKAFDQAVEWHRARTPVGTRAPDGYAHVQTIQNRTGDLAGALTALESQGYQILTSYDPYDGYSTRFHGNLVTYVALTKGARS